MMHVNDPIDVQVGATLRARRKQLRISQTALAEHLGMTFQQIQKYERGNNRVSASVLYRACDFLEVPVSYMFEGVNGVRRESPAASGVGPAMAAFAAVPEIALIPALDLQTRKAVARILRVLADHGSNEPRTPEI